MSYNKTLYNLYIKSYDWNQRKKEYISGLNTNKCEVCCKNKGEHVHHKTYYNIDYDNPGNEKDGDLLFVCIECHEAIHKLATGKHSSNEQDIYIGLEKLRDIHKEYVNKLKEEKVMLEEKRKIELIRMKKECYYTFNRSKKLFFILFPLYIFLFIYVILKYELGFSGGTILFFIIGLGVIVKISSSETEYYCENIYCIKCRNRMVPWEKNPVSSEWICEKCLGKQ
ncbi:hypothetical protein EOM39_06700 [Candidatus Gracilibacteria bacterium]|nr:hypothetical protein [Candidatus Gracilibacteria bacterium]